MGSMELGLLRLVVGSRSLAWIWNVQSGMVYMILMRVASCCVAQKRYLFELFFASSSLSLYLLQHFLFSMGLIAPSCCVRL